MMEGRVGVRSSRFGRQQARVAATSTLVIATLLLACTRNAGKPAMVSTTSSTPAAPAAALASPIATTTVGPIAASSGSAPPAAATAPTQSPSRVETVKTVYDLLLDRYYKSLKPTDILPNAWKGATQAAGHGGSQVEAPKLTGDRNTDWQAFNAQYTQLFARAGVQGTQLAFAAVDAMASGLHDDHTYFLNPDDNKRRRAEDSGGESFVGVGITISQRPPYTVQTAIPGGPADQAGIRPGDAIAVVDGVDASKLSVQELGDRLRGGQSGSQVTLTIKRGDGTSQDVTVTRAQVAQPAIESKLLPGGVGYLALHNFSDAYARFADGRNIAEELDAALQSFEQSGVQGWVFDVRGNPGGSEQTLAEVAGRFLPDGLVLIFVNREGHATEAPVDGHLFGVQRPLAVLIDGQSGSASELLAATMKEYGRARLFGQRTAGSVNGGEETELPDGAAIQYTVVEARTGKDHKLLDGVGVSPDETVSGSGGPSAVLSGKSDPQFEHARDWVLNQSKQQPTLALTPPPPAETLSAKDVQSKLKPFGATKDDLPAGPVRDKLGYLVLTYPNELAVGIAADVPNASAFEQKVRDRHWQGGYEQFFGAGAPAPYSVEIDLYRDDSGARDAVKTDDYPYDLTPVNPPAHLGDDTGAYTGYDAADGISQIVWRRGRLVFTVQYAANPGEPGMTVALDLARRLDARAAVKGAP